MWLGPVAPTCTLNRVLDSVIHRCVFAITKVVLLVGRACQRTDRSSRSMHRHGQKLLRSFHRNGELYRGRGAQSVR